MGIWGVLILVMAVLWLLQIGGTYLQVSHYRKVLGGVGSEGGEGYAGVGNAKSTLGRGVILILVSDVDGVVRRALKMRGRTVFARFEEESALVGIGVDDLADEEFGGPCDAGTMLAARRAAEQIEGIRGAKEVEAGVS